MTSPGEVPFGRASTLTKLWRSRLATSVNEPDGAAGADASGTALAAAATAIAGIRIRLSIGGYRPELLDEGRRSGHEIRLEVEGEPVRLPAGLDLTAYRIVQEGLTNARRHAPGAVIDLTVRWRAVEVEVEVADDGPGPPTNPNGVGHGLIGMR